MKNSPFDQHRTIHRVTEVMTDLAICELVGTEPAFATALLRECGVNDEGQIVSVRQSVHESSLGETDVELIYRVGNANIALLIENKIRAPIMPQQFARYRERGLEGATRGKFQHFKTLLAAPEHYIVSLPEEHRTFIDVPLSYEWILDHLEGAHHAFKRHLFLHAIEDARAGYSKKRDTRMTAFHQGLFAIAEADYPFLRMSWMEKAGHDDSLIHLPDALPVRGDKLALKVKMGRAEMRLETRTPIDMELALRPHLPREWRTTRQTRYAGIEVMVGALDPTRDFEEIEDHARLYLDAGSQLQTFYDRPEVARTIAANRGIR